MIMFLYMRRNPLAWEDLWKGGYYYQSATLILIVALLIVFSFQRMDSEGSRERIVTAIEDPDRNSYSLSIRLIAPAEICVNLNGIDYINRAT